MPGHSRSKNGVASLAYVPGIHVFLSSAVARNDGRNLSCLTTLAPFAARERHCFSSPRARGEGVRFSHNEGNTKD
jgi:hypothetical protein